MSGMKECEGMRAMALQCKKCKFQVSLLPITVLTIQIALADLQNSILKSLPPFQSFGAKGKSNHEGDSKESPIMADLLGKVNHFYSCVQSSEIL